MLKASRFDTCTISAFTIRRTFIFASLFALTTALFAGSKPATAKAVTVVDPKAATVVDQGSLGIFQNGQRIATETFTIRQYSDSSITSSEFHGEAAQAEGKIEQ